MSCEINSRSRRPWSLLNIVQDYIKHKPRKTNLSQLEDILALSRYQGLLEVHSDSWGVTADIPLHTGRDNPSLCWWLVTSLPGQSGLHRTRKLHPRGTGGEGGGGCQGDHRRQERTTQGTRHLQAGLSREKWMKYFTHFSTELFLLIAEATLEIACHGHWVTMTLSWVTQWHCHKVIMT